MKKLFILLMISALYFHLNAQTHSLSISGGINRTNITSDFSEKWNSNTGFTAAFGYGCQFANGMLVETGIRYHQTGFNDDMNLVLSQTEIADINMKYMYDYVGVPVKFGYVKMISDNFPMFAKIGLYPAFLTKGQMATTLVDGILNDPAIPLGIIDFKDHASKFNLAGLVEVGVGYRIFNHWTPFLTMTYQHSLIVLGKDHFNGMDVRHYGLIFSLGVKYDL